jgi:hypothetical protein
VELWWVFLVVDVGPLHVETVRTTSSAGSTIHQLGGTTMAISRTKKTVLGAVGAGIAANPAYDGYVGGKFVVTSHDAHLNAKVDGYGWAKLKQVNSNTTVSYSSCISGRDVILHSSIAIQVCKDKVLADDCSSATARR